MDDRAAQRVRRRRLGDPVDGAVAVEQRTGHEVAGAARRERADHVDPVDPVRSWTGSWAVPGGRLRPSWAVSCRGPTTSCTMRASLGAPSDRCAPPRARFATLVVWPTGQDWALRPSATTRARSRIGSIAGIDVMVRTSWLLVAALIAYVRRTRDRAGVTRARRPEVRRRRGLRRAADPVPAAPRDLPRDHGAALRAARALDHAALHRRRHRDREGADHPEAGVLDLGGRPGHLARSRRRLLRASGS